MKIRTGFVQAAFFLLLAFISYQAHQVVRHLVGALLCNGFGTMTFTVAETRQPCSFPTVLTLSGPVFTYGLAWLGVSLLRSPRRAQFGYALIFASFAPLRAIQTLTGRGDELVLAQQWFGASNRLGVAAVVLLIGFPPAIFAFRALANQRRGRIFALSLILPVILLFAMLLTNKALFGSNESGVPVHDATVLGVSTLVLVTDLVAVGLLGIVGRTCSRQGEIAERS